MVKGYQYKYDHSEKKSKYLYENTKRQRENGYRKQWEAKNRDKIAKYNLFRQMHKTHNITKEEWENCLKYFEYSCAYCGMTYEEHLEKYNERLHMEHVDHDGDNSLSNCVPSCKICNSQKHTNKLEEWYSENNPKYDENKLEKILNWINYENSLYGKD